MSVCRADPGSAGTENNSLNIINTTCLKCYGQKSYISKPVFSYTSVHFPEKKQNGKIEIDGKVLNNIFDKPRRLFWKGTHQSLSRLGVLVNVSLD